MLKLARNALTFLGTITDDEGQTIQWDYFRELNKLQQEEGLKMGNKLSLTHIKFETCLRSRGGWSNNPNCLQLKYALRQIMTKNAITASKNANCVNFETNAMHHTNFSQEETQGTT